jgi:MSHA biogenesis protein MshL
MIGRALKLTVSWSLPVFLLACSTTSAPPDTRTFDAINEVLDQSIASNQAPTTEQISPDNLSNALLPSIQLDLPEETGIDTEPRFDIKVNRTNARQFFVGLVEGTPYNMVVHPKVRGKITLDLKNVSIQEVMDVVRDVYGFDYEQTVTAYHVYPNEIRTKIFKLDYLAVKRAGSSKVRISSGQVSQSSTSGSSDNNNSDSDSSTTRETLAASSIDTVNESDFWSEMRSTLTAIVGVKQGRSVVVSPQSGVIVVRAMPDELRSVDRYLTTTENIMHRQVLLEAKVIEVTLSDGFQSGINWAALKENGSSSVLLGQTGGGSLFENGTSIIDGNTGNLNPGALVPIDGTAASAFGGMFTAMLDISGNFAAFIELLKKQGDVQVLSSPQVSTMNNQKAVIKVGTDEFFITDVETNTNTSSATSNTQNNVELTPFFSGVALDVIPQISDDNTITLHVHPTVVDVTEEVKNLSISGDTALSVPLAVSSIRESDSIISAKSGQVVIIGGLMKTKTVDNENSIPFLGDLPLVGGLFRHNQELTVKTELVILLKPTVIERPQQWAQELKRVRKNINNLRRTSVQEN